MTDSSYIAWACSAESPASTISAREDVGPDDGHADGQDQRARRAADGERRQRRSGPAIPRPDQAALGPCAAPVADAADGRDVARRVGVVAELVAQPADVDVDRPVEDLGLVLAVDRVEQLVAGQDPAVGLEDRLRAAGTRRGSGRSAVPSRRDLVAVEVDDQVGVADRAARRGVACRRRRGRRGPAQDRLDAQDELGRRERLGQVVVGAVLEAGDPVDASSRAPTGSRIGVAAASSSRRTARITARPSSSGSIRSRTTSAGRWRSMASSAAGPSAAVTTVKPSRSR